MPVNDKTLPLQPINSLNYRQDYLMAQFLYLS